MTRPNEGYANYGIPGQGNPNPHSMFANHALALVNGKLYDPSYGKVFTIKQNFNETLKDMEDELIDAHGVFANANNITILRILKSSPAVLGIKVGKTESY